MRSALALISLSRQNKYNCFGSSELSRNTILNMRIGRKVCKNWWDGFWTQTMTQILTKTQLLLFSPFAMFLEICKQIYSVVFALRRQINKQKYVKKVNLLCAGNNVFVKYQANRGFWPQNTPLLTSLLPIERWKLKSAIKLSMFCRKDHDMQPPHTYLPCWRFYIKQANLYMAVRKIRLADA